MRCARTAHPICLLLIALAVALCPAAAQETGRPTVLPDGYLHRPYYQQLQPPAQGTAPWHWRVVKGTLPPGVTLEPTGVVGGAPTGPGEYHFTLEAADSATKPTAKSEEYIIVVPPPLTVNWIEPPHATGTTLNGAIEGELEVKNGSGRTVDLTVIVVAVNTFNKATALGYQHFSIGVGAQRIPFGSTLPRDSYIVHADAVAEIAETLEIYRARLQTGAITVP